VTCEHGLSAWRGIVSAGVVLISLVVDYQRKSSTATRSIRVSLSPKIRVLPSGAFSQIWTYKISPRHVDRRRVRYKQRQRANWCWQHLAATGRR